MTILNAAVVLGLVLGAASDAATAADVPRSWHFTALLDGKPIGEHDFAIGHHGDETVVESVARFRVRLGFIPVYHYDHRDHEVWRNGRSQAGEYQTLSLLRADGREADPADLKRYALRGPHLAIDLWYSPAGDWVALESKLASARTLRYELR